MDTLGAWPLRLVWVAQPFTLGPLVADALAGADQPSRSGVSLAAWLVWGAILLAMGVPRAQTLTAVRVGVPATVPVAVWAAFASPDIGGAAVVGLTGALAATALALTAAIGAAFVDGSSYGDERRFPLRPGAPLLLGPIEAAWAVAVGGAAVGPLALLDRRWVLGAIVTAVGLPAAWYAVRALHQLARRWVVFVPAGLVLHDPVVLREPVLFPRSTLVGLGPAPADTAAHDLTSQALGLALRLSVAPAATFVPASRSGDATEVETTELLFTPSRPGSVLAVAAERRLPVG